MKTSSQLYRAICYRYGVAVAAVIAAIIVRLALMQGLGTRGAFVTCYPAVVLASVYGGLGPGLLATVLLVLGADYLWMEPAGQLALRDSSDMLALSIFALTGGAIAWVVELMHRAERRARTSQVAAAAQEALRQGEERLRFALETTGTGAWDLDLVDHTAVRSFEHDRIFGYSELLPRWTYEMFLDHVLPEDRAAVDAKFQHASATHSDWSFECRIRRVDGEVRWISAAGRHRFDPAGTARRMVGIVQDVTARKQAEEQLQAERDFSTQIIQKSPVVICEVAPDGRITFINPAGEAITGYRAADLIGKNWWQVFYPGEQYRQVEQVFRDFEKGELRDYEMTLTTRDGSQRTIAWNALLTRDAAGRVVRSLGFGVDVTERKHASAVVQASQQMLQTVVNYLPAAVTVVRGSDLRLQLVNPAYQAIAPGKEMIGKTFDEVWPETGENFSAICRRVLETGEPHQAVDDLKMIRRQPDGPIEVAYFSWSLHRIRLPGEEGWGLLNTAWETTARVQLQFELRRRNEELAEEARRRDEFLAMLGHELRNPLAAVTTAIAVARRDPQRRDRALEIAEQQAGEMAGMVDDLLDAARITQGKITLRMQRLSLGAVLERAAESARSLIDERGHELHVELPEPGVAVEGDAARLRQVFVNLLGNAAKFTPPGGCIEVVCEPAGAQVLVHVRDNGMGIDAALLPHVFDLFAQGEQGAERAGGGLGVGLAVVRRLAELHGGSVRACSEGIGRGAQFTVCLPVAAAVTAEIASPPAVAPPLGATSVLVVEDNPAVAATLSMLLEGLVQDVRVAADGPAALQAVRARPPALALIDIGLPGMNGYEVARAIRALPESPGMVLVALTGYGREGDKSASRAAGFDHHLTKPLDLNRLNEIVQQARVARRQAEDRCAGLDH